MAVKKGGLGRGLGSLFEDTATGAESTTTLNIADISPDREQPRRSFSPESLDELAASISQHGVLQPLVVRPRLSGRYEIVAGERRWRAARIAGLTELPVVVKELSDEQAYEIALIENLMREDLDPVEEALGYRSLIERFSLTQEEISERVGRSRPAVANALRLLSLPEGVLQLLSDRSLSAGHARALIPLDGENALSVAQRVVAQGLSVRQTEDLVRSLKTPKKQKTAACPPIYREFELSLGQNLSRRVKVRPKGSGKGELVIEFYSDDELLELGRLLGGDR